METLKDDLKIFRYIYSKGTVSFKTLKEHFKNRSDIPDVIKGMLSSDCITIVSGIDKPILGDPIPDSCILTLTGKGAAEVESRQWFNVQYVITSILVPIAVGVVSSLITALLLALLA